jgi:hypothetical protein
MALYNFKKQFVPMILSGEKGHTIRAKRARATRPGEMLHLYTGLRQKGAQLLMRTVCTKVEEISIRGGFVGSITTRPLFIAIDGVMLSLDESERLARSDGFADLVDMCRFWQGRTPFLGDIIHWSFPPTSHKHAQEKEPCANARSLAVRTSSKIKTFSVPKNVAAPTTTKNAANCARQSVQAENRVRSAD